MFYNVFFINTFFSNYRKTADSEKLKNPIICNGVDEEWAALVNSRIVCDRLMCELVCLFRFLMDEIITFPLMFFSCYRGD